MHYDNPNYQPDLSLEKREALVSGYEMWNGTRHWDVHLNLRPKSSSISRAIFATQIGCAFADVERSILGNQVFNKNKSDGRYRIHRSVFIEKEHVDIHTHILLHIPTLQTHVTHYWDVDLEYLLRDAWYKRCRLTPDEKTRNFHWEPIVSGGINGYPLKECRWYGNTDNWDHRSSFMLIKTGPSDQRPYSL